LKSLRLDPRCRSFGSSATHTAGMRVLVSCSQESTASGSAPRYTSSETRVKGSWRPIRWRWMTRILLPRSCTTLVGASRQLVARALQRLHRVAHFVQDLSLIPCGFLCLGGRLAQLLGGCPRGFRRCAQVLGGDPCRLPFLAPSLLVAAVALRGLTLGFGLRALRLGVDPSMLTGFHLPSLRRPG